MSLGIVSGTFVSSYVFGIEKIAFKNDYNWGMGTFALAPILVIFLRAIFVTLKKITDLDI